MNNIVSLVPLNRKEVKDTVISYFFYETGYGQAIIASTSKGVCYVGFGEKEPVLEDLKKRYSGAAFREQKAGLHKLALDFMENEKVPELPLHIAGTDFQLSVWKALLQIPVGKLSSYKAIAVAVNHPKAVRAVGSAIGDNPVSCIIPCHRVIRSNGGLGGYFWGVELKRKMIEKEAQTSNSPCR